MGDRIMTNSIGVLSIAIAATYIIFQLTSIPYVELISSFLIFAYLIVALPKIKGKVVGLVVIMFVLMLFFLKDIDGRWNLIIEGVRTNMPLVSIFLITPLLSTVISTGNYVEVLKGKLYKVRNNVHFFYWSTTLLTHGLGYVINIGSVSVNYVLTEVSNVKEKRVIAAALNRGFITTVFWSPYFAAMALIVNSLNMKWSQIGVYAGIFAFLTLFVSYLLEFKKIKAEQQHLKEEAGEESIFNLQRTNATIVELVILLILMVVVTLMLDEIIFRNMVLTICLVSIFFPLLWNLLKRRMKAYRAEIRLHIFQTVPNLKQELTLFLFAGLFSSVFINSSYKESFIDFLSILIGGSTLIFILILVLIIGLLAFFGVHPVITVTILVTSINPLIFDISKEIFALTLLLGWGVSNTIAPTTAVNNIISKKLKEPIEKVSLKWNIKFFVIIVLLIPVYLMFIQHFFI